MTPANPLGTGLPGSLHALAESVLALVGARVELFAVELQEQKARAEQKLVLAVLAALFLAVGLLLAAFLVVVLFWETHRMAAASGATLFCLGIGGWALVRLWQVNRDGPPPFAATMSEFADDLRLLRGRDE